MSRAAVASLEEIRATGLFLEPLIPDRAIVQEVRISGPSQMSMGRCLSPRPVSAGGEQGS